MRVRWSLLAALGLLVVVAGCGTSGETSTPTSTTSTTSATTTTVSAAQLDARLLDVSDVGAGWQVGAAVNAADFVDATRIPCGAPMDAAIAQRLTPVAGVQFEPTDQSYKHLIEFAVTGEPTQLESDLQTFWRVVESCSTVPSSSLGQLTIEKLAIPALGDQRTAFTLRGTEAADGTATWHVRDAAVRVGSTAIELGLAEIVSTPQETPQISDAEFVTLLETAVGKLSG